MRNTVCAVLASSLLIIAFQPAAWAQDAVLAAANRKTAVRFLKLSEQSLIEKDWDAAYSQAQMGTAYDANVSDLWYIEAASESGNAKPRAVILPLAEKALTLDTWVDYNRDGARVLYADLLCDTGSYEKAVGVLDAEPFIYSADAEYIRIKAYYRIGTPDSLAKARSRINGARKIYSADMRFPRLFFRYEYALKKNGITAEVQAIADSFISRMPEYDDPDAELEIYTALFASGARQVRMLQAFAAHGMRSPLYAAAALGAGLLTQEQAADYFCSFADTATTLELLESFCPLITDDNAKKLLVEHLTAFSGVLTADTDGDLEPNLTVQYQRGRPQTLAWDKNNDGVSEWTAQCDFGVPQTVRIEREGLTLCYGTYPAVIKADFDGTSDGIPAAEYTFPDETYEWSPFNIKTADLFKDNSGFDFYVPYVDASLAAVLPEQLLKASSGCKVATDERMNGCIMYSLIDGVPQTADYYSDGKLYARTVFEKGIPSERSMDNDGDGSFETTERFGYDPEDKLHMEHDDRIARDLAGMPGARGIYIKVIQVDEDGDTVPDFTEEYLADGGKITSWDTDADGKWDVRFRRYPLKSGSPVMEDAQFYMPPEHTLVTITSSGGEPVKVTSENFSYSVEEGLNDGLYWIGAKGSEEDERKALERLNQIPSEGVSLLAESGTKRLLAVRVGGKTYVEILPDRTTVPYDDGHETGR